MSKPVNNALSNYDNKVEETSKGSSGFASSLLSGGGSVSLGGLVGNLTGSISSFMSDGLTKLNELGGSLTSGLLSKMPNVERFLNNIGNFMQTHLPNTTAMFNTVLGDASRQLHNATVNYLSNIAEDLVNNLAASMYIPDEAFCVSIKGLYYGAGADLAYDNHYIRKSCLRRDWSHTLEFVDSCYELDYNPEYTGLSTDLDTCASCSCIENLRYMFGMMKKHIDSAKSEMAIIQSRMDAIQVSNPGNYTSDSDWSKNKELYDKHKSLVDRYERLMMQNIKKLIVSSTTYVTPDAIRKIFDEYKDSIKPKYLGETDDKYNKNYLITSAECVQMMPPFVSHDVSKSDQNYLSNVNNDNKILEQEARKAENDAYLDGVIGDIAWGYDDYVGAAKSKTSQKLAELRRNVIEKQISRTGELSTAAVTGGANGVYETTMKRYPKANSLKDSVKFKKEITGALGTAGKAFLYNDAEYVIQKNKNIKAIYVLLSSRSIWGDDRMVNEAFYQRCMIPTMDTLTAAADKAKGILGTSMLMQSMFDLQDFSDSSGWKYTKSVEKYLLDPAVNISDPVNAGKVTFNIDSTLGITIDRDKIENSASSSKSYTSGSGTNISSNGSNPDSVTNLNNSGETKQLVDELTTYASEIPMIAKRDLMVEFLDYFYSLMTKKGISEAEMAKVFSNLCKYVFGVSNITSPTQAVKIFNNSTNDSLTDNVRVIVSIQKLNIGEKVLGIENSENRIPILNLLYLSISLFGQKVRTSGLSKALLKYDRNYLASYLKALYNDELEYLDSINIPTNNDYKLFWPSMDVLTLEFEGFNRAGILGYNEVRARKQYTNIITGDWKSAIRSEDGMFFGGSPGIYRLNDDESEIVKTNVETGSWHFAETFINKTITFFGSVEGDLYYWDPNKAKAISTGVTNFNDWEIFCLEDKEIIVLSSKTNGGFRYWNKTQFVSVTDQGGGWKYRAIKDGIAFYPTTSPGSVVLFSNYTKRYNAVGGPYKCICVSDSEKVLDITLTIQNVVQGVTNPTSSSSSSKYRYLSILVGTTEGLKLLMVTTTTGNPDVTTATSVSLPASLANYSTGIVIPYKISNDQTALLCDKGLYRLTFKTSGTKSFNGAISLLPTDSQPEITNTSRVTEFISVSYQSTLTEESFIKAIRPNNNNTVEQYRIDWSSVSATKYSDSPSFDGGTFFELPNDENNTVYWRPNTPTGIYRVGGSTFEQLCAGDDTNYNDWNLKLIKDRLFACSGDGKKGVRVLHGSKFISVGLDSGTWEIGSSDKYFYAGSAMNTNNGVRLAPINGYNVSFVHIPNGNITYNDYPTLSYDYKKRRMFFGCDREYLNINIADITFDIDEYIYPLELYQIYKHIDNLNSKKVDMMFEFVLDQLEDGNDLMVLSEVLDDQLMGLTVGGMTLEDAINSVNKPGFATSVNSLTNTLEKAKFLLTAAQSGQYPELVPFIGLLQDFIEDNKGYICLEDVIGRMENFTRSMERSSGLYTNLLTYAGAMREFDVTNTDAVNRIIAHFVTNFDYAGNIQERINIISRQRAEELTTHLLVNFDYNGKPITEPFDSPEYKAKYVFDSEEFMNSDEFGKSY